MSTHAASRTIEYPETDGLPVAENTLQYDWITKLVGGLRAVFHDDPNVFVAGDLFWYPVEGDNTIRAAPDAMVAFGRPKGHRRSYLQWREGGITPQVVFEVLSPGNRAGEMKRKLDFYERFGVEEYYVIDPDSNGLEAWMRVEGVLTPVDITAGWTSPRLGVRFAWVDEVLDITGPDGFRFEDVDDAIQDLKSTRRRVEIERRLAEIEHDRAEAADQRAEAERVRAEAADQRAQEERERNERLLEKLRVLGIDPDA